MRPAEEGLLLLCCALGTQDVPLTPAQYRTLARRVRQTCQAGDGEVTPCLSPGARLSGGGRRADHGAARPRTDTLHRYLEAAAAQGITILTRLSDGFPARLRRMGETECPPALFCRGDTALLGTRCVALVGSRQLRPDNRRFAVQAGKLAAAEGFTLVSGGAARCGHRRAGGLPCSGRPGDLLCAGQPGWIIPRGKTCCIAARAAMSCRFPRRAPWPATASSTPWAKRPLWPSAPRERAGPGPVRSGTCAAACRSFTSLTTDRRQARHCSPAERRGCRIFRHLSPCYGPSNCPFSMGNRTKSGKSKFSVDFDKVIVYNLRTTPKIMDLT